MIRPAHRRDADFLAWAILAASRGHLAKGGFDIALSWPEAACVDFLRRLSTTEAPSWWHYSRFLVAEFEGRPVSALSAFPAGEGYGLSQAAMSEIAAALGLSASEQSAIWEHGAYIFLCAMDGHDDWWTMENIATLPSYRGRGLTTALLEQAAENGRARGFKEAQITSFIGNQSAQRAYEKSGVPVHRRTAPSAIRSNGRRAGLAWICPRAPAARQFSSRRGHAADPVVSVKQHRRNAEKYCHVQVPCSFRTLPSIAKGRRSE